MVDVGYLVIGVGLPRLRLEFDEDLGDGRATLSLCWFWTVWERLGVYLSLSICCERLWRWARGEFINLGITNKLFTFDGDYN